MRNQNLPSSSSEILLDSVWIPKHFSFLHGLGSGSTSAMDLSENNVGGDGYYHRSIGREEENEIGYEEYENNRNQLPGKKRRLTTTQVQFLEKNFEVENKLEPERKIQLAKQLGLQPRQVAIWFQNRRARFKNQRLEKDYDALKAEYDALKLDYDNLLKEKQILRDQIDSFKEKLQIKEKGDLDIKSLEETEEVVKTVVTSTTAATSTPTPKVVCKQEDASSAKSDVFDGDSPHYTDENSDDLSQEHKSNYHMKNNLPPPPCLLKIEEDCYYDDAPPPTTSCHFGFSVEDHPFWSWSY